MGTRHLLFRRIETTMYSGKRHPDSKARGETVGYELKGSPLRHLPVDRDGIVETPVDSLRVSWERRARLRRAIAHGYDVVEPIAAESIQVLWE